MTATTPIGDLIESGAAAPAGGDGLLRILYISSKRAKERSLLSNVVGVELREIQLHLRSSSIGSLMGKYRELAHAIRRGKPDVILVENAGLASYIAMLVPGARRIPLAVRLKGDPWAEYADSGQESRLGAKVGPWLNYRAGFRLLRRADCIVVIADHLRAQVHRHLKRVPHLETVAIPFGETSKPDIVDSLAQQGRFVLTVTNFNFWSKVEPLSEAVKAVSSVVAEHGYRWIILGDGAFLERFKRDVSRELAAGTVVMPGRRNPYPYYRDASVLFYSSGLDGIPNVVLEAFSMALPVAIDTSCPAAPMVRHRQTGFVLDLKDRRSVSDLFDSLRDRTSTAAITGNALEHLGAHYSRDAVSARLVDALRCTIREAGCP